MTGTLGILLRAKREEQLSEVGPVVQAIRRGGFRLADALVEEVLVIAGEADPSRE